MNFGMPNLIECDSISDCAELAKELSLDFIEVNMSFPQYSASRIDIEKFNSISSEYGIFYTIHADEALNPFDFNKDVSDCYFKVMKDTLHTAKAIGAKVVNMHLQKGIYVTLPERVILLTDVYKDEYIQSVKAFIKLAEDELLGTDIKISIENVDSNSFTKSQIEAIDLFMASEVFALTLDTGHENKLGYTDSHIFEKYKDKVLHMHLHDCVNGSPHSALGKGDVAIPEKINQLKGENCLIEVKTIDGLKESVKYLKERGYMI